jgi:hypothetical protein
MAAKRILIGGSAVASSLVVYDAYNPGFSRSIQFWSTLGPTILEYQLIKYKAEWEGEEGLKDLDRRLDEFHVNNAKRALGIITSLGGIYVKLGQVLSLTLYCCRCTNDKERKKNDCKTHVAICFKHLIPIHALTSSSHYIPPY